MLPKKEKNYSFLPVVLAIIFIAFPLKYAMTISITLVFAFWVLLRYKNSPFGIIILIALFLRIGIALFDEALAVLPSQSDEQEYIRVAFQILDNLKHNMPIFYDASGSLSVKSYSLFLAFIFFIFGTFPLVAITINVILAVLTGILTFKIALLTFHDKKVAYISGAIVLFFPSFIAFSSYILRDTLIMFLTFVMIYHFILATKHQRTLYHSFVAIVFFILCSIIRIQNLYLYTAIFILFLMVLYLKSNSRLIFKISFISFICLMLTWIVLRNQDFFFMLATYPMRAKPYRAIGGAAYLTWMEYNTLFDIVKYMPLRFIYFTFGPFIWNIRHFFQLSSAIEGFFILIAFIFTILYLLKHLKDSNTNIKLFLFLFCIIGLVMSSTVDSNFGTSVRHRIIYVIFLFIFSIDYFRNAKLKFKI